jgi:integrase
LGAGWFFSASVAAPNRTAHVPRSSSRSIANIGIKAGRPHKVPLSEAALDLLGALAELRTGDLVFEGHTRGRPLRDTTLTGVLRRLGYTQASVHGCRSMFRSWAADHSQPADIVEMSLAHAVGATVARAYQRSDLLRRRRELMRQWANFLLTQPSTNIVPLRASA